MKKFFTLAALTIAISASATTKGSWPTQINKYPSWPMIKSELPTGIPSDRLENIKEHLY